MGTFKNMQLEGGNHEGLFDGGATIYASRHAHTLALIDECKKHCGINWISRTTLDEVCWEDKETLERLGNFFLELSAKKRDEEEGEYTFIQD